MNDNDYTIMISFGIAASAASLHYDDAVVWRLRSARRHHAFVCLRYLIIHCQLRRLHCYSAGATDVILPFRLHGYAHRRRPPRAFLLPSSSFSPSPFLLWLCCSRLHSWRICHRSYTTHTLTPYRRLLFVTIFYTHCSPPTATEALRHQPRLSSDTLRMSP